MADEPTRVLAVANQKGGVGKTTVTVGLAEIYALHRGRRVLVIDADPQANTTEFLGVFNPEFTLNDVLYGDPDNELRVHPGAARDAIVPAGEWWHNGSGKLDVIAAERILANRERDSMIARESRLRVALRGIIEEYDVVIIDCPPALGLLTVNAMTVATSTVLVTEPRKASFRGVQAIARTMMEVADGVNDDLTVAGVVVNRWHKNRVDQEKWMRDMIEAYGDLLIQPPMPERETFAKAQAESRPLISFGPMARRSIEPLERIADKVWEWSE
ncbi:ParA family protein (plasmid) [Citricoccus nitrophenolicus]